jgi:hypothetical protein
MTIERGTRGTNPWRVEFLESLNGLTYEELATRKQLIDAELADIRAQLTAVRSRGTYADPQWYRATETAARFKGWQSQTIQTAMGLAKRAEAAKRAQRSQGEIDANRARRAERALTWERAFVQVAQRSLEPALFQALCDQAHIEFSLLQDMGQQPDSTGHGYHVEAH